MATEQQRRWIRFDQGDWRPNPHHKPRKISYAQAQEIRARRADGENVKALAAEYGVSHNTIRFYSD